MFCCTVSTPLVPLASRLSLYVWCMDQVLERRRGVWGKWESVFDSHPGITCYSHYRGLLPVLLSLSLSLPDFNLHPSHLCGVLFSILGSGGGLERALVCFRCSKTLLRCLLCLLCPRLCRLLCPMFIIPPLFPLSVSVHHFLTVCL